MGIEVEMIVVLEGRIGFFNCVCENGFMKDVVGFGVCRWENELVEDLIRDLKRIFIIEYLRCCV